MNAYDHKLPTEFSEEDCQAAVGKHASLILTGEIVEAGVSDVGPYVKFLPDERWGFGDYKLVMDLDAFDIEEPQTEPTPLPPPTREDLLGEG